ncbi:MAG: hypothetical protein HZB91_02685 [Elusimicrobia bacterium]|nr:hypothetical protein [Elusimicrobiota bacterium]
MTPPTEDRAVLGVVRDFLAALREAVRNAPGPADRSARGGRSIKELYARTLLSESALRDLESRTAVLDAEERRAFFELEGLAETWRALGSGGGGPEAPGGAVALVGGIGEPDFSALVARTEAAAGLWTRIAERERKGLRLFLRVSGAWRWAVATLLERCAGPGCGPGPAALTGLRGRLLELESRRQALLGRMGGILAAGFGGDTEPMGRRAAAIAAVLDALRGRVTELENEVETWRGRAAAGETEAVERMPVVKAQLETAWREAEGLSGQVQRLRVESSRLRARLDEEISAHAATRLAMSEFRAREARLTASLGESRLREDGLAGRVNELEAALNESRLGQEARAEVEAEDARLKDELSAIRAEKERADHERAELSDAVGLLQDALEARTALLAEAQAARQAMETAGSGAGLRVQALEEEVRSLHAAAMEAAMASGAEMKALQVEVGSLVHVLESEKARSTSLALALEAERAKFAALSRALEAEKAKPTVLSKEIESTSSADAASRQNEGLRGELAKAQVRLARLSQELESRFGSLPS